MVGALSVAQAGLAQEADLWNAIRRGQLDTIERYLSSGGDPNARISSPASRDTRWPLLQVALYDREEDIALALFRAGADFVSLEDTPLDLVAGEGMPRFFEALFDRHPDLLLRASPREQAGLFSASASKGYYQVVEAVLASGRRLEITWDPNAIAEGVSVAIDNRNEDIARLLLNSGAGPQGMAMRIAARSGSPGMMRQLLMLGGDPNAALAEDEIDPAISLRTPIDFAWRRYSTLSGAEREEARLVLHELIRSGASSGDTVIPAGVPRDGIAELEAVADPSERLVSAARLGYFEIVEAIVRSDRADPDALRDAASAALRTLHNDIAKLLIENDAPVTGGVLHAAAAGNSPGLVRVIVDRGADVEERVDGQTPLDSWWARAQQGHLRSGGDYVLHELLKAGANACWLRDNESQLSAFAMNFLRNTATQCWPETSLESNE